MKSRKSVLLLAAAVVLIAVLAGVGAAFLEDRSPKELPVRTTGSDASASAPASAPATTEPDVDFSGTVELNGVRYRLNTSLQAILFLGVDDGGGFVPGVAPGEGRRADTIFLFLLDDQSKTNRLLAISRDTIADVDVYQANGDYAYTAPTHINMQYYYGDSSSRSCFLMKRSISRLLYGMRIDGCLSMNAQGIITIVDELGGLTVTMPEDFTDIDPRYQAGAELTLTGAETEHLLRYRDLSSHGSNEDRVERQIRLIKSLVERLQAGMSAERLKQLLASAGDEVCSDLDAETLKKLVSYRLDSQTLTLPGEIVAGADHDEFHLDESALRRLLIELFYQPTE